MKTEDGTSVVHPQILTVHELVALTGCERWGDVTRSLSEQGIRFFLGKGGDLWTTIDLVNAAGGLSPDGSERTQYYSSNIL